jgi:DNA-binding protein H-NS
MRLNRLRLKRMKGREEAMAKAPAGIEDLDLESLSDGELQELMQRSREALSDRVNRRIDEFRLLAREAGFEVTLTKIGEGEPRRRRRRAPAEEGEGEDQRRMVAPKYQNPNNLSEKWSGRGRKPKWVEEKLAQGRTLADLAIAAGGAG